MIALAVSLLSAMLLGTGGFSSCCYSGITGYDETKVHFGILDVHDGLLGSSHCDADTALNDKFIGAATALNSPIYDEVVHAFWFLTSLTHGRNTCGHTGSAYDWGMEQAAMFVDAVVASGYTGPIGKKFADVEHVSGNTCSTDIAKWACDSANTNRQVIKGFESYIGYLDPGNQGVYSSPSQWNDITNGATASTVNANDFWLAYWGATQAQLNYVVGGLQNWGYQVGSWQYATDDVCEITYATANSRVLSAFNRGYYVFRFDWWDNDETIHVCQ